MASISVSDIQGTSCSVQLISLDETYGGGTRTCKWYFRKDEWPNISAGDYDTYFEGNIVGSPPQSDIWKVTGLTAETAYYCCCLIYNGTSLLATLRTEFTTGSVSSTTAIISFPDITDTSCKVQLVDLDTSYGGGTRACKWYFKAEARPTASDYDTEMTTYIYGAPDVSDIWELTGLTPGTTYYCLCYIFNNTSLLLATLTASFTTDAASTALTIHAFRANQFNLVRGNKQIYIIWGVNNAAIGGTYAIYINGSQKVTETVTSVESSLLYTVDDFGTYVVGFVVRKDGKSASKTVTVEMEDVLDSDLTPSYDGSSRGYRKITFRWNGTSYTDYYTLRLFDGEQSTIINNVRATEYTFTNLNFSTSYDFYVTGHYEYADGGIKNGTETYLTERISLPSPPTVSLSQAGGIVTVAYGVLHPSKVDKFEFYLLDNGANEKVEIENTDVNNVNPSGTFSFTTQLEPGVYRVTARTYYQGGACNTEAGRGYVESTISVGAVPPLWSWEASNGNASAAQTNAAYSAVSANGFVNDFSYMVWNDMVDKVKAVLDVIGENWDGMYATYDNTKILADDRTLTAVKFNSLRRNVGNHVSTGIGEKSTSDAVYGHYFTTITDCLNSWIQTITTNEE